MIWYEFIKNKIDTEIWLELHMMQQRLRFGAVNNASGAILFKEWNYKLISFNIFLLVVGVKKVFWSMDWRKKLTSLLLFSIIGWIVSGVILS